MKTNEIVIKNVKHWLKENERTHEWLAQELDVSKSLVGHMLSGKRAILPKRIEALSKITGIPMKELAKDVSQSDLLTVKLRGQTKNRRSKQELNALLFAIEDYVGLRNR